MPQIRTINSPGVQINEIDQSLAARAITGSSVYVMGYANKGEAYNPVNVISVADLETNFGKPQNEAERYFYYTCRDVLLENGNLIAAKLPYRPNGDGGMDFNYKYVPVDIGDPITLETLRSGTQLSGIYDAVSDLSGTTSTLSAYIPVVLGSTDNMSVTDYDILVGGGSVADFTGSAPTSEFVIVNERKTTRTGTNYDEGIFIAIVDPIHGMLVQRTIAGSDSDVIDLIRQGDAALSGSTFVENLSAAYNSSSLSETMCNQFPTFEFTENGASISNEYAQFLTVLVGRTQINPDLAGQLEVVILESWSGSIITTAKDPSTGVSTYLGDVINANSQYIKWYATTTSAHPLSIPSTSCLYSEPYNITLAAFNATEAADDINGQLVVSDMQDALEKVANLEEYQIDIVTDAGLSTIAQFQLTAGTSGEFNPLDKATSPGTITSSDSTSTWRAVASELDNFCKRTRKDCMAIIDVPRNLVLDADQKYIRKTAPNNTFTNTIAPKLKYITGLNSSYLAIYSDWTRMFDTFSGRNIWLPPSVKAAGIYVRTDLTASIWDAPAGLNRGTISEVNDLAFSPKSKEADLLYTKSFNYARLYPLEGAVLEGQKTSQVKPSAFDRVNVRRLFLRLERYVYQLARFYVDEPNNTFTRRNLVASIEPVFARIKSQGGLYDYRIVCDETNNPGSVIDANELKCSILLKPVRTAEFIIVDFIATPTDGNFDEYL